LSFHIILNEKAFIFRILRPPSLLKFAEKERSGPMNIHTYGRDKRLSFCGEHLKEKCVMSAGDFHLLPIPTRVDGDVLLGTGTTVSAICESISAGDVAVGYGISKKTREELVLAGASVVDVSLDESFLYDNACLTAIGTLGRIICESDAAPCEHSVGVIGFGRIGQCLVRYLLFFGAKVRVFTSKNLTRHDLCMLGISGVDSLSLASCEIEGAFDGLDILINTAPATLIGKDRAAELATVRVIELASGENLPEGTVYERFASVPAVMFARSAGVAMSRAVLRMLGEVSFGDGDMR